MVQYRKKSMARGEWTVSEVIGRGALYNTYKVNNG